jgi:kynurenine formamidase
MKIRTFVIGYAFALAIFLFAQQRMVPQQRSGYVVIDLTHSINASVPTYDENGNSAYHEQTLATTEKNGYFARAVSLPEHYGTHIDAPAHFVHGLWTVDQIPPERLVAPLVILNVTAKAKKSADYQVRVDDVADWEQLHGQVPAGAVVMARTGWDSRWNSARDYRNPDAAGTMHFPGFSTEVARFLAEGRNVVGLGIDTLSIDNGPSKNFPVHQYDLSHSIYQLENVANLAQAPDSGATVVVAPAKLEGGSGGPVRILAISK